MSLRDMIAKQKAEQEAKASGSQGQVSTHTDAGNRPVADGAGSVRTGAAGKLKFGRKPSGDGTEPLSRVDSRSEAERQGKPDHSPQLAKIPIIVQTNNGDLDGETRLISIDDIADDETTPEQTASGRVIAFHDEVPATAPDRDLPVDISDSQMQFVNQLNGIYDVMFDPELFGQMIRTIMQEMQEHPDYVKLMADQDVHTMIRGLRESMGLARVKKAEKKTRSTSKKAIAAPAMANTLDEMFNSEDW